MQAAAEDILRDYTARLGAAPLTMLVNYISTRHANAIMTIVRQSQLSWLPHRSARGGAGDAAVALEGPGGEVYSVGLSRLREQISSTQACADVCLVCLENIAPDAAVWTCRRACHVLLHLICAQAWGHQQLQQATAAARASAEHPDLCAPLLPS